MQRKRMQPNVRVFIRKPPRKANEFGAEYFTAKLYRSDSWRKNFSNSNSHLFSMPTTRNHIFQFLINFRESFFFLRGNWQCRLSNEENVNGFRDRVDGKNYKTRDKEGKCGDIQHEITVKRHIRP